MSEFPIPAPTFDGRSRAVPPGNALEWLKQGWALFLVNPGLWVAITLLTLIVFIGVQIVPWVGTSMWLRQRMKVDLPEPDGPIMATTSPRASERSRPFSTSWLP